eukprot:m.81906 g.81906  ORF g.81906 m.81906 type:complete len:173 (+) comp25466_c0_seq1:171-689(+)
MAPMKCFQFVAFVVAIAYVTGHGDSGGRFSNVVGDDDEGDHHHVPTGAPVAAPSPSSRVPLNLLPKEYEDDAMPKLNKFVGKLSASIQTVLRPLVDPVKAKIEPPLSKAIDDIDELCHGGVKEAYTMLTKKPYKTTYEGTTFRDTEPGVYLLACTTGFIGLFIGYSISERLQ